jgi:cytosine/adenosine deaminase-related metal-dependent hydrolase
VAAEPPLLDDATGDGDVTCIRSAAWIIAWDGNRHVYRRDGDVAWQGDRLIRVGGRHTGPVDEELDGSRALVMPGLVNIHCHPSQSAIFRGLVEEFGNPRLFYSSRHRFRQAFLPDDEAQAASARFALAELLANGVTTIVDLSHVYPGWLDLLAESGIRACAAPMFRSARWWTDTGQATLYEWAPDLGKAAFEEAVATIEAADAHPSGRLFSMVSPAQVDTCTAELLQQAAAFARATGRPLHTHAAQSFAEFTEMTRRHAMTPIEWLQSLGFLGQGTILGHAVFTDAHPWLHWPTTNDVRLLAETGTAVAHCPTVFARDGTLLHDLGSYRRAGVRIAIGTDTHPHSILEEIRTAEILARCAAGPRHATSTAEIFHCATVQAAGVLGRDDIGRLAVGAKADLVLCSLDEPLMRPVYDPLRSLVHAAADRAVRSVWIDGRRVVADGRVLTIDRPAAGDAVEAAQAHVGEGVRRFERTAAGLASLVPLSLASDDA